jgi:hypothetical protein
MRIAALMEALLEWQIADKISQYRSHLREPCRLGQEIANPATVFCFEPMAQDSLRGCKCTISFIRPGR